MIGCGAIGLGVIAGLKLMDIAPIVAADFHPARRDLAIAMGAHVAFDPRETDPYAPLPSFGGRRVNVIYECVGQPGMLQRIVEAAPPGAPQKDDDRASVAVPAPDTPVPVVLTRYAAQSLYAPLRTVEPVAGIARVNVRRDLALDTLMPALPVRLRAMAAWRLADEWVTAILLTNTSPHDLSLDPRLLQGDFVAAAFQHPSLGPAGQSTDTTVAYLVTHGHGLAESLLPAISRIDATVNLPLTAGSETMEGPRDEK